MDAVLAAAEVDGGGFPRPSQSVGGPQGEAKCKTRGDERVFLLFESHGFTERSYDLSGDLSRVFANLSMRRWLFLYSARITNVTDILCGPSARRSPCDAVSSEGMRAVSSGFLTFMCCRVSAWHICFVVSFVFSNRFLQPSSSKTCEEFGVRHDATG